MKVSNYHFSSCYANSGQFYRDRKKCFLRLLSAIFVPYFFSFAFVIMASTLFCVFQPPRLCISNGLQWILLIHSFLILLIL